MRQLVVLLVVALGVGLALAQAAPPRDEIASFRLKEAFGVHYPDEIVVFDLAQPVPAAPCHMISPTGVEVPYQVLGGGKHIAVRTDLPASRIALRRELRFTSEQMAQNYKFDTAGVENTLTVDGLYFSLGDAVQVQAATLPQGLSGDTNYYVTKLDFRQTQRGDGFYFVGLAATPGGPAIAVQTAGVSAGLILQALVANPATGELYLHAHGLPNDAPVSFRTHGELPQPLQPGVTYYVSHATADRFRVNATRGGKPIDLLTAGNGIHELLIDWTWTLMNGPAAKPFPAGVAASKKDDGGLHEITNDRLGVRIPASQVPADPRQPPAPVQGVRLADGTWTAANPIIHFTPGTKTNKITTTLVEEGPLKVVAEVVYDLDRAQNNYGEVVVAPGGPGKYTCRIEVQAGQPSVLFEEDTDCAFAYDLDLKGLTLNQARYRTLRINDKTNGWRPDGKPVTIMTDAFLDLPFDKNYDSSYAPSLKDGMLLWMHPWDPWAAGSGPYWMLYDKDGGDATPLLGYYDGRASRLRAAGSVGVGVYTRAPANGNPGSAGITVQAWQRGANAALYKDPRWQWRLFVGRKGPDLRDWREIQPINQQMNLHSGVGLNQVANLTFDFQEPAAGFGAMYMPKAAAAEVNRRLREDDGFYRAAYNSVTYYRDLIDMIRDASGARVHQMAYDLWRDAHDAMDKLVNQGGIMEGRGFYFWHGGLEASRALLRIDQVLASDQATAADKALVRQAAVFYGAVLWDDDHCPLSVPAGVGLGTANMPVQQWGYRDMYALYLATHPMMKGRAEGVVDRARNMLHSTINEFGAHMGSSHYIGAANGPLLSTIMQLKAAGVADLFKDEPRLKKYAEFEMNFSTPVDPRFGKRVRPSIGDACPGEATEFTGMLGTAFADLDPALSARLMGMWKQCGKPQSDFHGATIFKIDETLPDADPKLASAHFEGWYSVLRFGWGTPNETAAWFVNGNWYSDHASNDRGEPVIYALGAPLSVDFGTMYSPSSPGAFVHSVVLPEAAIGGDWKQNPPDLAKGNNWGRAKTDEFKAEDRQAWSRATFTNRTKDIWTRTVKVAMLRDDQPAIGIRDEFGGPAADASKIFLLNLMDTGNVDTPAGVKKPGDSFDIPAGITKLHFTGQTFAKHPTKGIDWDLYVITAAPQQAFLAHYDHKNVMPESQTILRLRGTGRFQVLIVPYFKGKQPDNIKVTQDKDGVQVNQGDAKATF